MPTFRKIYTYGLIYITLANGTVLVKQNVATIKIATTNLPVNSDGVHSTAIIIGKGL